MSARTQVSYDCDYDGKSIPDGEHQERTLAVDGTLYELDLCMKHSDRFDEDTRRYTGKGRRIGRVNTNLRKPLRSAVSRRQSAAIRAWARQQGIQLQDKGRIPDKVVAQYHASK